jgi:hypothetical protein
MYKENSSKEKVKTELFPKNSVPELNTTKLDNSPSFLTITHTTPFAKWFSSYGLLTTAPDWDLTFGLQIDHNSGSSEYHYGSQLSQLSDGT